MSQSGVVRDNRLERKFGFVHPAVSKCRNANSSTGGRQ